MAIEIATRYSPSEIEEKWYSYWLKHKLFHSTPDNRKPYTIVIPPPNVTGILHMGHMLNNTIQDILIRRKKMEGFNACWVPGTDHAAIATEAKVVNMLEEKGIKKSSITRDEFLSHAMEWKEKYGGIILGQLKRLGASCDWDRTTFTMDPEYYTSVIKIFNVLFNKGLIYRGMRMVNWDPQALTAVSDEEVNYEERNGKLYYVKYLYEEGNGFIVVATTRPETIMADTGIAVHPDDERYKSLLGKKVMVPFVNRLVPVVPDASIDPEFGTGCLKVTPAHDILDYEIGMRHNLPLIDVLNPNGTLNENAQIFVGEDRFVARKKSAKWLEERGLIEKTEDIRHKVGLSERTGAVIEPRMSTQWFLKMDSIAKPALESILTGEVELFPSRFNNTYKYWMENIRDWCISRQLWWGHRIPAWYDETGRMVVAENVEAAVEEFNKELPPLDGFILANERGNISAEELEAEKSKRVSADQLKQDPDVLDTWFSSWLWPIEVFKGISKPGNPEFNYYYPTSDLVTGPDILFFWVARMVMAGHEFTGKKPFSHVYLTGIVRDKLGRKMSKSLGNSPDPLDLMEMYGADGVRIGILLSAAAGNDLIFDTPLEINENSKLESKLCEQGRNFANKIWNAFRLVKGWTPSGNEASPVTELGIQWMEARIEQVKKELQDLFSQFRISEALMTVYKLVWDDFCAWFLEIMKPAVGMSISVETYEKVVKLFESCLILAHPFIPFITEELWQELRPRNDADSILLQPIKPANTALTASPLLGSFEKIKEGIAGIRALRASKGISMKESIQLYIKSSDEELYLPWFPVIQRFLNTSNISFSGTPVEGAASIRVFNSEWFVPISLGANAEEEKEKLLKEIEYTEGFLKTVEAKLSNEKFVSNAKGDIVEREKKKKEDAEAKLEMLRNSLKALG